ncbi:MAG TPA: HAD-IC family P-type ATPase [Candidatus Methylomirabilis sp.]|nr:HAD-IC family P-type ATPase [Candidatus Methylomirabilis sp.]
MTRMRSPRLRSARRVDIAIATPQDGRLQVTSRYLFSRPDTEVCRRFVGHLFEVEEISAIEVRPAQASAQIEYRNGLVPSRRVLRKIASRLRNGHDGGHILAVEAVPDLPVADGDRSWRVERHGLVLSTWELVHELPGRIRFRNRMIRGKPWLRDTIEASLHAAAGVHRYTVSTHTTTVLIEYDPRKVSRPQLVQMLDRALVRPEHGESRNGTDVDRQRPAGDRGHAARSYTARERPMSGVELTASAVSLGLSAIGDIFYFPLSLLSMPAALYVSRPLYSGFYRLMRQGEMIPVDALLMCVQMLSLLAGQFFLFTLNVVTFRLARHVLDKVKQDSRAHYTDVFRQQVQNVRVRVGGVETMRSLDTVTVLDLVSISAGQTIPVDGHIAEGAATVDQHLLTGEAVPVEKGVGDVVFALTVVVSGAIWVRVEQTGAATAAAQIARVLDSTVDFKTGRQLWAERLAERLVGPAFLSALATWPMLGVGAGAALLDTHPKYKTTLASSVGLLNFFKLAAREGLLIKDGRTLELLTDVDTVVFDKTGTLTLVQPHVRRLYTRAPHTANDILRLAATAEQHQSHPVALAIMHVARARGLSVAAIDEAEFKAGYGVSVRVERSTVRVGSARFLEMEGIAIPPVIVDLQAQCHHAGHSLVLVAIDDDVAGAIELHTTVRPEARRVVEGLRERSITSIYIISGDHEVPTRRLAERLGIEHYFAETLPEKKAAVIERLQASGKITCYVGDGINDSIAMKKSHVSVSLRGASTLAVDTAEVVLLDESLNQLCRLFDLARECRTSMRTTLATVLLPCLYCAAGVLLGKVGFTQARVLNVAGLVAGVGAAMLPLWTHGTRPTPVVGGSEAVQWALEDVPIDEHVLP